MAWRLLMRRSPSRSMTVVGDVAQTGDLAGTPTWAGRARAVRRRPVAAGRADRQLPHAGRDHGGGRRRARRDRPAHRAAAVGAGDRRAAVGRAGRRRTKLADRLVEAVRAEAAAIGDGRLGVLVPAARVADLGAAVAAAVPGTAVGARPDLTSPVVVLTVRQAKGLEFDSVLVVEPGEILAASPRGASDLYVALTRATQRLGVLHTGDLPPGLPAWRSG